MFKIFVTAFLLLFIGCGSLLSQDISWDRRELLVGISYFNVVNTWNTDLKGERNQGVGLFAEYRFPLIKKWKINAHTAAGVDKIVDCNLCETGWYKESVWLGAGLGTFFNIGERHTFTAQARVRGVGFVRTEVWLFDVDGNPLAWSETRDISEVFGLKLGYRLPIGLPLEFSYAFEHAISFANINTFSLAWRFNPQTKSQVKRSE